MKPDIQYHKEIPNICDWIFNFLFFVVLLALLWIGFGIQETYDAERNARISGRLIDTTMVSKKNVQNYKKEK